MIVAAAQVALAGMDPMAFLKERDPLQRGVYQTVAAAAFDLERQRDRARAEFQAAETIRRLVAALGRGRRLF